MDLMGGSWVNVPSEQAQEDIVFLSDLMTIAAEDATLILSIETTRADVMTAEIHF